MVLTYYKLLRNKRSTNKRNQDEQNVQLLPRRQVTTFPQRLKTVVATVVNMFRYTFNKRWHNFVGKKLKDNIWEAFTYIP